MNTRTTYFILCILGLVLPYAQFIPWLLAHGLDLQRFVEELFSTPIGGFFGMDVIVSACVLTLFIAVEGRRLQMTNLWAPIAGTFLVGVSFGLPLFLYMRHPLSASSSTQASLSGQNGASTGG
ncbi:hypothetical protein AZSI13_21260 [Azospira sp. I13]|uniref:DUF2834 domain-containing protein n=1 Tax=Azospira sp. I13 TaxID=1765050 RepID=UPI000D4A4108|nr:DUF2834 domain-containing protein [Azospira sp. I13]GBG02799.1 hypothetical protein AZSI13_21260 [Azospira sp. I13]